ncbi:MULTISPECIES: DUF5681 domain-containing protein [unclassified Bradyrhizobium]
MSGDKKKPYEVGYGKPPVATRFQKGRSGNPSGKPKKVPKLLDPGKLLAAIDNEEITVVDQGKRTRMTKAEIQFRQSFAKAIRGDLGTARLVVKMATQYFASEARDASGYELISATEAARRFGRNWEARIGELNAALRYPK